MMDYDQAKRLILLHGLGIEVPDPDPLLKHGFIGCLRPYSGLREHNFHELIEALLVVGERFHGAAMVDREIVFALWHICATARRYGIWPDGMLRRNKLISAEDVARLERWVDVIERMSTRLLIGKILPHSAVFLYAEYVIGHDWSDNWAAFLPWFVQAVTDPYTWDALQYIVGALGKLGPRAASVLPALRAAAERTFDWYEPADRCTNETRAQIQAAIRAIEGESR
jgi:hypothetical protein